MELGRGQKTPLSTVEYRTPEKVAISPSISCIGVDEHCVQDLFVDLLQNLSDTLVS